VPSAAVDRALDESLRFRRDFGLRRDIDHVRGLLDGSVAVESNESGVPLTAAEDEQVDSSFRVSDAVSIATKYGGRVPDSFGGAYVDLARGGLVYVGFTKAPERHLAELRKVFPYPAKLRLFPVRNTEAELDEVHRAVDEALPDLAAEGVEVHVVSTDIKSNVVEISLESIDRHTVARLEERFGRDKIQAVKSPGQPQTYIGGVPPD